MSGPTYPGEYPSEPTNQPGYPQYPQPQQPPPYQPPAYQPAPYQPPAYQPPPYQPPTYQPPAQPPKKSGSGRAFLIIGIIAAVLLVACVGLCATLGVVGRIAAIAVGTKASQVSTQFATQASSIETQASSADALLTVTSFCQAESSQDYTTAYQQLSPTLQQQYSQTQFTQDNQHEDTTVGPVTVCSPTGGASLTGSTASVTIAVTRESPTPTPGGTGGPPLPNAATGQISLVQDSSGNWTISSIDSSLHLL